MIDLLERLSRVAAIIGIVAVVVISLVPGNERPHTGMSGNAEHFIAYGMVAGALGLGFVRLPIWLGPLGLSLFSGFAEICQIWIPGRSPGVDNWVESTFGAVAGAAAALAIIALLRRYAPRPTSPRATP